ncbi:50S ribosomal protein L23 [Desulfosporosinus sp. BICA1-9]|uniref:50S ribosomal protein L23 n=1 Tax=Desulfosporosinus sp. BICA1-9 TaxID=1531958 RepID=UPI00054C0865|nr:50S ribosomal protein L23 [Desulfosporosinus sp. BICA1-9]KJS49181.1 MAG: 50S ribosomal protein L23 [Peptococcaceae bacterium BRH_c23]KJS78727.1 MAG: 50S ribosomal protein L23 [Desulfosporosinus sp. BICA1-9]
MRDARDVLKSPVISEKSVGLVEENKYTFWVNPAANKIEIKAAVEKMFKVTVEEIRTLSVKGKMKRVGKYAGKTSNRKKAIATLKAGDKIDNFAGL